ncbi:MAG: hypothetical protein WC897_05555 [Candidatus Gracilibacteria bacterium]
MTNLKKILPVAFISLAVLFSSCGSSDELSDPSTVNQETYNGIFTSLGNIKVNSTVTHLFETDDGDILYAYSDRYNLDDKDYLGTRVEAYGTVSTYETLDKPLFNVKRITEAKAEDLKEEVTALDYKNTALGVSFTYLSDWAVTETLDSLTLTAPAIVAEEEAESEIAVLADLDTIWVVKLPAGLTKTSTDEESVRIEEIQAYTEQEYPDLSIYKSETNYVGVDQQLAVKYKTELSDLYYFVPRGSDLYEISFHHSSLKDELLLDYTNIFSNLVASFRFLPTEGTVTDTTDTTDVVEPVEPVEEVDTVTPDADQVEFTKYGSFDSNFGFSISYPSPWYYSGTSGQYIFANEEVEDTTTPLVKLRWSSSGTAGTVRTSTSVSITVNVDSRYYTLTGTPEYETAMQKMSESIKIIEE